MSDWFSLTKKSLFVNKLRSGLTLLGVAVGVMSVSLLTAIGEGVNQYITTNFSQFGSRIVAINPGRDISQSLGGIISSVKPLSMADVKAIAQLPQTSQVAPMVQGVATMKYKQKHRNSDVLGTSAAGLAVFNFNVAQGQFLPPLSSHSRPLVVLGAKMKTELFGNNNALGEYIRVAGFRFKVIGVMEPKGQMMGYDFDDLVYIPADRALAIFNRESLMEVDVIYGANYSSEEVATAVSNLIEKRHKTLDVTITTQDQMMATLSNILNSLTAGIGFIASISLFVGGVGIYTIMTIAIEERTGEVGLLKAIGATNNQVTQLFLAESVLFGLLGAVLGVLMAGIISLITLILVPEFPLYPHFTYVSIAIVFAMFIGLVAGLFPALKAAKMTPIEALRAE